MDLNFITELQDIIPHDLCEEIINKFENDERKIPGSLNGYNGTIVDLELKNSTELHFTNLENWSEIDEKMSICLKRALYLYFEQMKNTLEGKLHCIQNTMRVMESISNGMYDNGFTIQRITEGNWYPWHHDSTPSCENKPAHRILFTVIIYLNTLDVNSGGTTSFFNGRTIKPEVGKVLIFPATWNVVHTGDRVLKGTKYICTSSVFSEF